MKTKEPTSTTLFVPEEEFRKLETFLDDFERRLTGRRKGFRVAEREHLREDIESGQQFWIKLRGISWEHPSVKINEADMRHMVILAKFWDGQVQILISSQRGNHDIGTHYYTNSEARAVLEMVQR